MSKFLEKKEQFVELISDFILKNGVGNASLKQLALSAGTSDRMLLHYFKNKEEIITLVMVKLTSQLISILEEHVQPMAFSEFISLISTFVYHEAIKPYTRLAMELAFHKNEGEEYYNRIASKIFNMFYEWIEKSILEEDEETKLHQISLSYVILEGLIVLDQVGLSDRIKINPRLLAH